MPATLTQLILSPHHWRNNLSSFSESVRTFSIVSPFTGFGENIG